MAERPWIDPNYIRIYTSYDAVRDRTDLQLEDDIARAEELIGDYCRNYFDDNAEYPEVPDDIKRATRQIAQVFALNASAGAGGVGGAFKSESIGDYSYTMAEVQATIKDLGLESLLNKYRAHGLANNQIELECLSV